MPTASAIRAASAFVEISLDRTQFAKGLRNIERDVGAFGARLARRSALLFSAGFFGAALPLGAITRQFAAFDQELRTAASIVATATGDFEGSLSSLESLTRRLGRTTSFTAQQVAEAAAGFARGGFSGSEISAALESTLDLARGTGTDLAEATSIAISALRQFEIPVSQAAQVMDVLAFAANNSNQRLVDLSEGLKLVAPLAKEAGIGLETVSALLGVLANRGIRGSIASTALARSIKNLVSTTNLKQLRELTGGRVDTTDRNGNLRPLQDILADIDRVTKNFGNAQRLNIFEQVFGRGTAAASVLAKSRGEIENFVSGLRNSQGTAARLREEIEGGLQGSFLRLVSAIQDTGFSIVKAFEEPLTNLINAIIPVINAFSLFIQNNQQLVTRIIAGLGAFLAVTASATAFGLALQIVSTAAGGLFLALQPIRILLRTIATTTRLLIDGFAILGGALSSVAGSVFNGLSSLLSPVTGAVGFLLSRFRSLFIFLGRTGVSALLRLQVPLRFLSRGFVSLASTLGRGLFRTTIAGAGLASRALTGLRTILASVGSRIFSIVKLGGNLINITSRFGFNSALRLLNRSLTTTGDLFRGLIRTNLIGIVRILNRIFAVSSFVFRTLAVNGLRAFGSLAGGVSRLGVTLVGILTRVFGTTLISGLGSVFLGLTGFITPFMISAGAAIGITLAIAVASAFAFRFRREIASINGSIISVLASAIQAGLPGIGATFTGIGNLFSALGRTASKFISAAGKSINRIFHLIVNSITSAFASAISVVRNILGSVFDFFSGTATVIVSAITRFMAEAFNRAVELIKSALSQIPGILVATFGFLRRAFLVTFREFADAFRGFLGVIRAFAASVIPIFNQLKAILTDVFQLNTAQFKIALVAIQAALKILINELIVLVLDFVKRVVQAIKSLIQIFRSLFRSIAINIRKVLILVVKEAKILFKELYLAAKTEVDKIIDLFNKMAERIKANFDVIAKQGQLALEVLDPRLLISGERQRALKEEFQRLSVLISRRDRLNEGPPELTAKQQEVEARTQAEEQAQRAEDAQKRQDDFEAALAAGFDNVAEKAANALDNATAAATRQQNNATDRAADGRGELNQVERRVRAILIAQEARRPENRLTAELEEERRQITRALNALGENPRGQAARDVVSRGQARLALIDQELDGLTRNGRRRRDNIVRDGREARERLSNLFGRIGPEVNAGLNDTRDEITAAQAEAAALAGRLNSERDVDKITDVQNQILEKNEEIAALQARAVVQAGLIESARRGQFTNEAREEALQFLNDRRIDNLNEIRDRGTNPARRSQLLQQNRRLSAQIRELELINSRLGGRDVDVGLIPEIPPIRAGGAPQPAPNPAAAAAAAAAAVAPTLVAAANRQTQETERAAEASGQLARAQEIANAELVKQTEILGRFVEIWSSLEIA